MSGVSAFIWQAAVLLLVAYFLGAWIGCWLRRWISPPPKIAMEADTLSGGQARDLVGGAAITGSVAAAGTAAVANRFGRALEGDATSGDVAAAVPSDAAGQAPAPSVVSPETGLVGPALAGRTQLAGPTGLGGDTGLTGRGAREGDARPAHAAEDLSDAPKSARPEPSVEADAPDRSLSKLSRPMTAAAAAAREAARRLDHEAPRPARDAPTSVAARMETLTQPARSPTAVSDSAAALPTAASGSGEPGVVMAPVARPADAAPTTAATVIDDNLTLIASVSQQDADALRAAGIKSFAEIAAWTADDVRRFNQVIGGDRRISRENWIEQAQLLKDTRETAHTRKGAVTLAAPPPATERRAGERGTARQEAAEEQTTDLEAVNLEPSPEDTEATDLVTALEATVTEAQPIEETAPAPAALEAPAPESNSVNSAAALAAAAASAAANIRSQAAATEMTETEKAPVSPIVPVTPQVAATKPAVSERAAFARARPHAPYRENLQRIEGINSEVEQQLYMLGVTRISQIADWSESEQDRIDRLFGATDRIRREDWAGQARALTGVKDPEKIAAAPDVVATQVEETAPSTSNQNITPLATTPAAGANVRGLRSVRSEALIGSRHRSAQTDGDDLKRIRGIGALIEKRLQAMGYATYEDIGSWTQADVDRVNQQLDFRGRIERENWVEQARILSSGG